MGSRSVGHSPSFALKPSAGLGEILVGDLEEHEEEVVLRGSPQGSLTTHLNDNAANTFLLMRFLQVLAVPFFPLFAFKT